MKSVLYLVALLIATSVSGQVFSIKRLEILGEKINLYYDLIDTVATRTYTIALYASQDNFISPLHQVSGDIGLEVKPGRNKRIVWNAKDELGANFEGKAALEVRGRLYIPFIRLDGLNRTFKRLRPTEITWAGGTQQNILNFDLYKGDEKIHSFTNIANVGHYTLTMPITIRPGDGYHFKIADTRNKDQVVISPVFAVKRNIPLLIKIAPVVMIGAVSYLLISGKKKSPKEIPDPSKGFEQ
jgi:hypothetical protein